MKTNNIFKTVGLGMAISALAASQAGAITTIAYDNPTGLPGNQGGGYNLDLGMTFTVNAPISVTALGAFSSAAFGSDGVNVAIYQVAMSGHNILGGSEVVTPVDFTTANHLAGTTTTFQNISPVTLGSGTYMIVADNYGGAAGTTLNYNRNYTPTDPTQPSANTGGGLITYTGNYYNLTAIPSWGASLSASGWTFDNVGDPGNTWQPRYGAGDFAFTAVPEVQTFAIAGVSVMGLVFIGRKVATRTVASKAV